MSEYNTEQLETLRIVRQFLKSLSENETRFYKKQIEDYFLFRKKVSDFSRKNFSSICRAKCFENKLSACCTKEGIITYFADVFINAIHSDTSVLDNMESMLHNGGSSKNCVYLGNNGCIWLIKPIVCEMFFCDFLISEAEKDNPSIKKELEHLKLLQKNFTWPDKPVYFNTIEEVFIERGYHNA